MTRKERDALLARARELDEQLYPEDDSEAPGGRAAGVLREAYYGVLIEYADRLPRVRMSACPFTGEPLIRAFDPWGLDGPWWHADREVEIEEPAPPSTFRVLLGAVAFHGRDPVEARAPVVPGPEVPFVVPRLLELPGMVAVISELRLETGDTAYPVAYFSTEEIDPELLHQPWLQDEHWFETDEGESGWLVANDPWDFELGPWLESGKVLWIEPGEPDGAPRSVGSGEACPYVDLPGERLPQSVSWGERELLDLPDGSPVDPYED